MEQMNSQEFMASGLARTWSTLGCILLLGQGIGRMQESDRFSKMLGVMWLGLVIYLAWCTIEGFRHPIFTLDADGLRFRHMWTHRFTRVSRENLERVMWQKPGYIRFFSRDGKGCSVSLGNLSDGDRRSVRRTLREDWGLSDVAV